MRIDFSYLWIFRDAGIRPYGARCLLLIVGFLFICCGFQAPAIDETPILESDQSAQNPKIIEIPFASHDGHEMFGKLTIPPGKGPFPVVIYVQTAEGATVDQKRQVGDKTFNYMNLYAEHLPRLQVAFFCYEGRGIRMGDNPPRFESVDPEIYNTSTLENKVKDILTAVNLMKKRTTLDPSRIWLLGSSEGTMLAAQASQQAPRKIKGLICYGVMTTTLRDNIRHILGKGSFLQCLRYFDLDKDGRITADEFQQAPEAYRARMLGGAGFDHFDLDGNGLFELDEVKLLTKPILDAVDLENFILLEQWAKAQPISTPKDWVKNHFSQQPVWKTFFHLQMPIAIFHGDQDASCPIEAVREMEKRAKAEDKNNMRFFYFKDLDHTLDVAAYFLKGEMPSGHQAILNFIKTSVANLDN